MARCHTAGLAQAAAQLGMRPSLRQQQGLSPCPGQPKVADFEGAGGIDQQVGGLQVAVDHVGAVDVLQPTQHLQRDRPPSALCSLCSLSLSLSLSLSPSVLLACSLTCLQLAHHTMLAW